MKFYTLAEIPTQSDDEVFKTSPTGPLIWFIVFSGVGIALLWLAIRGVFYLYPGAATSGFCAWISLGQFRACMKPTNWLLRCNGNGVIIKYRSYQNWRFPAEDAQAVGFDYSEIAWARTVKEQRTSPGMGMRRTRQLQNFTWLDFCLANAGTSDLEAHLQAEQNARSPGRIITTAVFDYPVEVLPGGIVQLRWNGISPSAGKAIEYLGRHVKIAAAESEKIDLTHRSGLVPGAEDAKILALIKSGDRMGAVKLARQSYGSSLSEAMALVEKLQSGG